MKGWTGKTITYIVALSIAMPLLHLADPAPARAQFGVGTGGVLRRFRQMRQAKRAKQEQQQQQTGRTAVKPDVAATLDIAYGKDPLQKLDIYAPRSTKHPATNLPVLIFAHGGGWKRGDKKQHGTKGNAYAEDGIVFVSINYRLSPKVMHPAHVEDVAAAIAFVKQNIARFGGDPGDIFLMGHSAGAHLVDLVATNDRFLKEHGLSLSDIKGVISLDTASLNLMERLAQNSGEARLVGPMIETSFGKDPTVLKDGSPTLAISRGKSYPPFLMFCGSRRSDAVEQHQKFEAALDAAGGRMTFKTVPLSHKAINQAAGNPQTEIYKDVLQFVRSGKN